jgi:hypothetical protein
MDAKYSQYPPQNQYPSQNQYPQQNLYPQYPPPQQQQQPPIVINVPSSGYPGMRPIFACHFTY